MSSSNLLHRDVCASRVYSDSLLVQRKQAEHEVKGNADINEHRAQLHSQWAMPRNTRTIYVQEVDGTPDRTTEKAYSSANEFHVSRNGAPGYFESLWKSQCMLASSSGASTGDTTEESLNVPYSTSGHSSTDYDTQRQRTISSGYLDSVTSFNNAYARVHDSAGQCSFNRLVLVAGYERLRLQYLYSKIGREFTMTFEEYCINQLNSMREEEMSSSHTNETGISSVHADTDDKYDDEGITTDVKYWTSNDCEAHASEDDFGNFDGWDF